MITAERFEMKPNNLKLFGRKQTKGHKVTYDGNNRLSPLSKSIPISDMLLLYKNLKY
jgi:hypothetical protein